MCFTEQPTRRPLRQGRPRRAPPAQAPAPEPEQNADDIVDISYVGASIPSRSFKILQHAIGEPSQPGKSCDYKAWCCNMFPSFETQCILA